MEQVDQRRRTRVVALGTTLITLLAGITGLATTTTASAADPNDLLTSNVVTINETVSEQGFVHPGIGLTAADLRNAQQKVRADIEPWASYFDAMSQTAFASTQYRASNSKSAVQPDVPLDPTFVQVGMRNRETNDSFGALTQSLMWVITGQEVYRRNAIQALRTWASMDPHSYRYFADAHIHTGHPLYQFLMAAEIIRATDPLTDDSPGSHEGYNVVWSETDDSKLLGNFAYPVVNTFLYSNTRWMNQHNFGLFGRIATAIYADDADAFAKGVEWFTVNSTYDGYDNGALAPQIPLIEASDPRNPYGHDFVQVREMGRDQAHGECNIDNFTGLARMLEVQGTKVDPVEGTVSTGSDAVSAYDFLGQRLLDGANAFFGFMMGARTPWVDERGEGWDGSISEAYRGRMFNAVNELYNVYARDRGVDVDGRAPWVAELSARLDGPVFYDGTLKVNFWAPGDKNPEYWVAFPEELAGEAPPPVPVSPSLPFDGRSLQLDKRTTVVQEGGESFARARVSAEGTTTVVSRIMHDGKGMNGVLLRSDGPAVLEVFDKEPVSGQNPDEIAPLRLARIEVPDTASKWRYFTYPESGTYVSFLRLSSERAARIDLREVRLQAEASLTPPSFAQPDDAFYLTANDPAAIDLAAQDSGGGVAYAATGGPTGAAVDAASGAFTWVPRNRDKGTYDLRMTADDGESMAARRFQLIVSANRQQTIRAAVKGETDVDAVYTQVTREPFEAALTSAKRVARDGTDEEFAASLSTLLESMRKLKPLNPTLPDGTLDYRDGVVFATVLDGQGLNNLADDSYGSGIADLRVGSFTFDFGSQYRVTPDSFGLQARFTFGNRLQGTNVYGSNDAITWDRLTERETENTNDWQTISVASEHVGTAYRYLKLQVDNPGTPTDPAYPGLWSFSGLRIRGERSEVVGTIERMTVSSPDDVADRVTEGDAIEVSFSSPSPITEVSAYVAGRPLDVSSADGLTWSGTGRLGELTGGERLDVTVEHTTMRGERAATLHGSTDGTFLYGSDERDLVDLRNAMVVDSTGAPDAGKAPHAARMLDSDPATFSDVAVVDDQATLTWDFGEGSTLRLDRADFLPLRDNNGMIRLKALVLEGSNDLRTWTRLTDPARNEPRWQNLPSAEENGYRYLRAKNVLPINIVELRLFGELHVDLDGLIARAEAVDLNRFTRASGVLFPREIQAVRDGAESPDADEKALARRLLGAWQLLTPASASAPAAISADWVIASTGSADGTTSAPTNGWRMFDGSTTTYTQTATKSCEVTVVPTDGTAFTVESVRFHPRSDAVPRSTGMKIEGSNDGGATWMEFANTGSPVAGWNERSLATPVRYSALRIAGGNGYCNVAELQFIVANVDRSALRLLIEESGNLNASAWTSESWTRLHHTRTTAQQVVEDRGASQDDVDNTSDELEKAIASLQPA